MTPSEAAALRDVFNAFADGKEVQYRPGATHPWSRMDDISFLHEPSSYRIAPAAKARKVRTVACWCFAVGGGSLGYLDRSEAKSYRASLLKSHQPIGALRRVLLPSPKKASKTK